MERISIGFAAGQTLSLRVEQDAIDALQSALGGDNLWHKVSTDEGDVSIRLDTVVYLRSESSESKVGFGL
ncbi:MAG: hypothetical protein AAGC46_16955 [Solirubrobacteraceae bacterium]|nr:hypothetical protein [Patulibacter sp.]